MFEIILWTDSKKLVDKSPIPGIVIYNVVIETSVCPGEGK